MTIHNERIIIVLDRSHVIQSATVFPIEYVADDEARPLKPVDLSDSQLTALKSQFVAATVAERDALRIDKTSLETQVTTLTSERDLARDQLAAKVTAFDLLTDDHIAVTAERDQLTAQVEQLQSANAELQGQVDALTAQLDAILHPPGPDLSTLEGVKSFISSTRYAKETSGITIEGQQISTERDEIGHWFPRFYNAYQWLQGDAFTRAGNPTGEYPYKPKQGEPVLLSAAQVVRAYLCLSWYINACFAVERGLYQMAESGSLPTAIDATNANSTWPQTEFTWEAPQ